MGSNTSLTPLLQNTRIPHHRKPRMMTRKRHTASRKMKRTSSSRSRMMNILVLNTSIPTMRTQNDKDEYSESSSYLASTEGGPAAEDGEAHMATATGPAVAPAP